MSLDATIAVVLAESAPQLEAALREVAKRAYEVGYREALAHAQRAGIQVRPRPAVTMIAEAPRPSPQPAALPPVVVASPRFDAPPPAPPPQSPAAPQPPLAPPPIVPAASGLDAAPASTTAPWSSESVTQHLSAGADPGPHADAEARRSARGPAVSPPVVWAVPALPSGGDDDELEAEDAPASLIPKVYFDQLGDEEEEALDGLAVAAAEEGAEDDEDAEDGVGPAEVDATEPTQRERLMAEIEDALRASPGAAISDLEAMLGVSRTRIRLAMVELREAGRAFQGGEKRFARYALDLATALAASEAARRGARGPAPRDAEVEVPRAGAPRRRDAASMRVRPSLTIGALRARIVKVFGLERFAIDVVVCKRGDARRRQIRADYPLRTYYLQEATE